MYFDVFCHFSGKQMETWCKMKIHFFPHYTHYDTYIWWVNRMNFDLELLDQHHSPGSKHDSGSEETTREVGERCLMRENQSWHLDMNRVMIFLGQIGGNYGNFALNPWGGKTRTSLPGRFGGHGSFFSHFFTFFTSMRWQWSVYGQTDTYDSYDCQTLPMWKHAWVHPHLLFGMCSGFLFQAFNYITFCFPWGMGWIHQIRLCWNRTWVKVYFPAG